MKNWLKYPEGPEVLVTALLCVAVGLAIVAILKLAAWAVAWILK